MTIRLSKILLLTFGLAFCHQPDQSMHLTPIADAQDVHSFAQPDTAVVKHMTLALTVDFGEKSLSGYAEHFLMVDSTAQEVIFDINGINIDSVWVLGKGFEDPAHYRIGDRQPFLGAPLTVTIPKGTERVRIYYKTGPDCLALQWLGPQQTHDKRHPFLFTQGQAILTRTWIPCQDSPGIRFTYDATITVPADLMAIMSARNPQTKNASGVYSFEMTQPIPAYLLALAVGDIAFDSISHRTGVYAEPGMLEAAAYEMADLEKMVTATEALYGPYQWERFDLIILPPSFPFGGMENPRLTFATPTIIAGDRSLIALVAHELAHSWSGNLVTNATWDDFWLNEGHTVYLERRIMEALYGKDYTNMLTLLGYQDLQATVADLGPQSTDTHLKLALQDRDPDDGMTDIAYEKGFLLLKTLEDKVGRPTFDEYLKEYFDDHAFQSLSTEQWVAYLKNRLLISNNLDFPIEQWVYQPGIPEEHSIIESHRFERVDARVREYARIGRLDRSDTKGWSTHEWLHFVRHLPADLHTSFYEKLDEVYQLSESGNAEILAAWFELSIKSGYMPDHNQTQLEAFLISVGRRKFLTPLYKALIEADKSELAKSIFSKARKNYHSVSEHSIAELLKEGAEVG